MDFLDDWRWSLAYRRLWLFDDRSDLLWLEFIILFDWRFLSDFDRDNLGHFFLIQVIG